MLSRQSVLSRVTPKIWRLSEIRILLPVKVIADGHVVHCMCTDYGPNWLRFAGLILERVQKSKNNIGFQPTITDVQDGFLLQEDLDCLLEWSKYWHLDFNIEKCKMMRIQHKCQTEYELNGNKLQEAEEEKV